jgi:hypothetical protein
MHSIDWSSVALAAIPLAVSTWLSILATRNPEGHDDVPDFLPPEREGAALMLLFAAGMFLIAVRTPTTTLVNTVAAIASLISGANAVLVACVLFRIHRAKSAVER